MTTLITETQDMVDDALDIVEQTLAAADWVTERSEEGALHCAAPTRWGECGGVFAWRDEPRAIHFSLTVDLRAPDHKRLAICDLLARINERLCLGHFDYWAEDGVAMFRHTLPMLDRTSPETGEIAAVIAAAQDAVEQFLPAFNFVVWSGKTPAEAVEAALFETLGEA
ncbi:MAG: YbjN domain-containing protein [Pseudomonadota bacterium]